MWKSDRGLLNKHPVAVGSLAAVAKRGDKPGSLPVDNWSKTVDKHPEYVEYPC